ncbi:MAG: septal ring lytic transglycosylase RlpA family protein [Nitrospirota bacterium]
MKGNFSHSVRIVHLTIALICCLLFASCASRSVTYPSGYAVASWYGAEFHGRPTSSGEIFNMYAPTCAHREYPFGTKLKVTNVASNKSTYCIVNDRGPFVAGRDIDLSMATAREIGLMGTGPVKIEYAGRDNSYIKNVKYAARNGPFTIQVGSFRERANAMRLKEGLDLRYERVHISESHVKGDTYYRVRIGKFAAREDVNTVARELADEGYSVFVTGYEERI